MTTRPLNGTLADVYAARRAFLAVLVPWPKRMVALLPFVVLLGYPVLGRLLDAYGGTALLIALVAPFVLLFVVVVVALLIRMWPRANLPLRPGVIYLWSRRVTAVQLAMGAVPMVAMVWALGGAMFHTVIPHWIVHLLVFVLAAMVIPSMYAVAWRMDPYGVDSRLLRKVADHPAVADPLIAARLPLMVCAMLASVERVGGSSLARAVQVSDEQLGLLTMELVRAQYIYLQPDRNDWWFGLTPAGRVGYRRHVRSLLGGDAANGVDSASPQ